MAIATDLLAWFKLLGRIGELARAEPKTLRYRLLSVPAGLTRAAMQVTAAAPPLALVARPRPRAIGIGGIGMPLPSG